MLWSPPRFWEGERVFVLGGGPSISKVNLDKLKGKRVIGTNNIYKIAPWIDILFFMDCVWYDWHKDNLIHFTGILVTVCESLKEHPVIKYVLRGNRYNFDTRAGYISGNNSGAFATSLGLKLGAAEIVLVGFDMQPDNNGNHNFHKEHKRTVPDNIYQTQHIKPFLSLVSDCNKLGVKVFNATETSSLKVFPFVKLEDML